MSCQSGLKNFKREYLLLHLGFVKNDFVRTVQDNSFQFVQPSRVIRF
jgi:hypothetical protein